MLKDQTDRQMELLTTKNIDMKGRRVIGAADAIDDGDYITKRQSSKSFLDLFRALSLSVKGLVKESALLNKNVLPKIGPVIGSLVESSIIDDGLTVNITEPINIDIGATSKSQLNLRSNALGALSYLVYSANDVHHLFDCEFNGTAFVAQSTSAAKISKISNKLKFSYAHTLTVGSTFTFTGDTFSIDLLTGGIGFFGGTPTTQKTLNAYTTDAESGAYTGLVTGVGGSPYASITDLNNLRVAYENLRASYDDLRSKLKLTTLVL